MKQTLVLFVALAAVGCTKVYNQPSAPTPVATATTPVTPDAIEFRVFGNPGPVAVLIKFTNSIDGATAITAASLPYVASIKSTEASIFLDLEAVAVPLVASTATLQCQIYVNGKLFREAIAIGVSPLTVSASGTFRRGE